ncbi:MAG: hypothetical protein Q4Q07_00360 [Tissierellia bacterium]|nr:hypothetical protein [Tissierellia bacterium]
MKPFLGFLKKEWKESLRTYKFFILVLSFSIFGIISPLTAKFTPQLIENFIPDGFLMNIPEPVAMNSWIQYIKNISQIGMFLLALLFSGQMSQELLNHRLTMILAKGLPRYKVILAKFTLGVILWTIAYGISYLWFFGYTKYFWDINLTPRMVMLLFLPWLFGLSVITSNLLGGMLSPSNYGSLLFTSILILFQFLGKLFPKVVRYLPINLLLGFIPLLKREFPLSEYFPVLGITVFYIIFMLLLSILLFHRKEM